MKKGLYGTLQVVLLFWKDISEQPKKWEFKLNTHNNCVANKTINKNQSKILWHVDELKILHVSPMVVDDIIDLLNERYAKESPLSVTRGKVHDYSGMMPDFPMIGSIIINMIDYPETMLEEARDKVNGESTTPGAKQWF